MTTNSDKQKDPSEKILKFNGSRFHYNSKNITEKQIKDFVLNYKFPPSDYVAYLENGEVLIY